MERFLRIFQDSIDECYISNVYDDLIYYGHVVLGHQNKLPTACMTVEYYNKLLDKKLIIGKPIL